MEGEIVFCQNNRYIFDVKVNFTFSEFAVKKNNSLSINIFCFAIKFYFKVRIRIHLFCNLTK